MNKSHTLKTLVQLLSLVALLMSFLFCNNKKAENKIEYHYTYWNPWINDSTSILFSVDSLYEDIGDSQYCLPEAIDCHNFTFKNNILIIDNMFDVKDTSRTIKEGLLVLGKSLAVNTKDAYPSRHVNALELKNFGIIQGVLVESYDSVNYIVDLIGICDCKNYYSYVNIKAITPLASPEYARILAVSLANSLRIEGKIPSK